MPSFMIDVHYADVLDYIYLYCVQLLRLPAIVALAFFLVLHPDHVRQLYGHDVLEAADPYRDEDEDRRVD